MTGPSHETGALVGRAAELSRVASLLRRRPPVNIVLLGAAGCGKTRLALEIVHLAEERGRPTTVIRATRAAAAIPLGALAPILAGGADEPLEQRVDTAARAADAIIGQHDLRHPGVFFVDDAHLLDTRSCEVVRQLAASEAMTVLATVRSPEPVPEPLRELASGRLAECFAVADLGEAETAHLASQLLGGPLDGASALSLYGTSRGNPLFVRELLFGAFDAGYLTEEGGVWRLLRPLRPSARLAELIGSRLADLPADATDALHVLAVAEQLGRSRLVSLTSEAAVESLERRELAVTGTDRQRRPVRLAHPLYGELARASMGSLRRLAVHRRLADALEADGVRRREDTLALGMLRLEAGGDAHPELLLAAARQAHGAWAEELAIRLGLAAARAGAGPPAQLLAAEAMIQIGRDEEGEALLRQAVREATSDRDKSLAAIQLVTARFWGQALEGAALLAGRNEALDQISDPAWQAELVASTAIFEALAGEPATALAQVEPMLTTSRDRAYVAAALAASSSMLWTGRLFQAEQLALAGAAARSMSDDTEGVLDPSFFLMVWVLAVMEQGRFAESGPAVADAYGRASANHNVTARAWSAAAAARLAMLRGRIDDCARYAAEAAALFGDTNNPRFRRLFLGMHAHAELLRGDVATALDVLTRLTGVSAGVLEAEVTRAMARADWEDGHRQRARDRLALAAADAARRGSKTVALFLWHDLAMLGGARTAAEGVGSDDGGVDGELAAARVAHIRGIATGNTADLEETSARFEAMGALLCAADAAAAAAAAAARIGDPGRALRIGQHARILAAACGVRSTPSMRSPTAVTLTAREHEVASLAARGLSNPQVAARLGLSVRTVENHLQHAFHKLGISDRVDLTPVMAVGDDR